MNIEEIIRNAVNEVNQESRSLEAPTAPPAAPAASPITVNIQGKQVTFRDQADLEAQLNATAQAIAAQNQTPPPAPQFSGSRVTDDDDSGPKFNQEEFIRMMNEDPRKANNYLLSHSLFDGKVEDAVGLLRETMISQAQQAKQLANYQFHDTYRDVPLENPQVEAILKSTREELGLPHTSKGMEAAYIFAVGKGKLPNFQQVAQAQIQQYQQQQPQYQGYNQPQNQNPYLQGPPQTGRSGSGAAPVLIGDYEDMSADQLQSLLNKLSNQGIT